MRDISILLIEDDDETAGEILSALAERSWGSQRVSTVGEGLSLVTRQAFSAVVLDRMLPDGNGMDLLQALAHWKVTTPVLVLSALGTTADKVEGLDCGADDYMAKPFDVEELCARIRVLARRAAPHPELIVVDDLEIWCKARTAYRGGRLLKLTPKEFDLLQYLAANESILVTRPMITQHVFKLRIDPGTNVVEVHVHRLREKLDREPAAALLHTVRGKGYILKPCEKHG